MTLALHYHPLSSYCWKVLIALYENATAFAARPVDFGDPAAGAALRARWPLGKIPLLEDGGRVVPETSVMIEYLQERYPGPVALLPADPEARLQARLWDRFYDSYVMTPMQKIVADRMRAEGRRDPQGVEEARALLRTAYGLAERQLGESESPWAAGAAFTLADCAAFPALFYAGVLEPYAAGHPRLAAYFERLLARPSAARVLAEAKPWFHMFPYREALPARFQT